MENSYLSTLGVCVPALGLCSAGIQLSTIRARFYYNVTSVATDKTQWPLRDLFKLSFLVFKESPLSPPEKELEVKKYTDMHRNFLENIVPFAVAAFGVATLVSNPSSNAVTAVKVFTVSRILHSMMFICFPYQPFRAIVFVPQLLSQLVLFFEIWKNRR